MSTLKTLRKTSGDIYNEVERLKNTKIVNAKNKESLFRVVNQEKDLKQKYKFFRNLTKKMEEIENENKL